MFDVYRSLRRTVLALAMLMPLVSSAKAQLSISTPVTDFLTSSTQTFTWTNSGADVSEYWLTIGTQGYGSSNISSATVSLDLSKTVSGLPTNGWIFVRLWAKFTNGWGYIDRRYQAADRFAASEGTLQSPLPGSEIPGKTTQFSWVMGGNTLPPITAYWVAIGTSGVGSNDLYSARIANGVNSVTLSNLPASGTIYVRVWTGSGADPNINWGIPKDFFYLGSVGQPAELGRPGSPTPGSLLPGATATFDWSELRGTGNGFWLQVGTTGPGSSNLLNRDMGKGAAALTNWSVTNLPSSGTIYVRLWSGFGSGTTVTDWKYKDYTYKGSATYNGGMGVPAVLHTPPPGTLITSTSATFGWLNRSTTDNYFLTVGTTGVGSGDIFNANVGTAFSSTVTGLPSTGTIYVRLWSENGQGVGTNKTWTSRDYTYRAGPSLNGKASYLYENLVTQPSFRLLPEINARFSWGTLLDPVPANTGTNVAQNQLYLGTTPGGKDLYDSGLTTGLSVAVPFIRTGGLTVYARLWSLIGTTWVYNDSVYKSVPNTIAGTAGFGRPATMAIPLQDSLLAAASTFNWDRGEGVSQYWMSIGTVPGGDDIYSGAPRSFGSAPGLLPGTWAGTGFCCFARHAGGSGYVYVRLWSLIGGNWQFTDTRYRAPL